MEKFIKKSRTCAFKVVLILLIISLFFTGCRHKAKFEKGFDYTFAPSSIMAGVCADTDLFTKDNVTLELSYGVYYSNYCEKYGTDPKSFYDKTHLKGAKIFFGLYICDSEHCFDVVNDMEIADYKAIDNHYFVREVSEEEAFSEEYGFAMSRWKGITYNHSEAITIPEVFCTKESGSFHIKLIAFLAPINEGDSYYTSMVHEIGVSYQRVDGDVIKIFF